MKPTLVIAVPALAAALAMAPVAAQETSPVLPNEEVEELAREGMEKLLQALELMIRSIPQYEAPVMDENGDIIIRRHRPRPEPEPPAPDEPTETRT